MFNAQILAFVLLLFTITACDQNSTSASKTTDKPKSDNHSEYITKSELYGWLATLKVTPSDGIGSLVGEHLTAELTLRGVNGGPLENASLRLGGGMPGHGHGLPSAPQITASLGDGRYLVEGLKFNMTGDWVLSLGIYYNGLEDKAIWKFNILH